MAPEQKPTARFPFALGVKSSQREPDLCLGAQHQHPTATSRRKKIPLQHVFPVSPFSSPVY